MKTNFIFWFYFMSYFNLIEASVIKGKKQYPVLFNDKFWIFQQVF